MSDHMMNTGNIRPEDIVGTVKEVGTVSEPPAEDLREFVFYMGPFEKRDDPRKTKTPSLDELKDMDNQVLRRFLATPDTNEERETRFKDTAAQLGLTPGELMLRLAVRDLAFE